MVLDPSGVNCIRLLDGNILGDSKTLMINHLGHEKFFSGNDAFSRRTLQQNLYIGFNKKQKIMQYKQTGLHYYVTNTEQQQKYLRI